MDLIVGIPACNVEVRGHPQHATPARYGAAVMGAAGAMPILIPPVGEAQLAVLDRLDGLLLSGSPSNVHPSAYSDEESATPDWHDMGRDETILPIIRAALDRGLPVLAICRGIQELNVALGGTLFQQVLIIANTTRKLDATLLEAARTLGTKGLRMITKVVIPGILPDLYRDQRILLGWAWTYLIVAELIGTSTGITWFITQQARYQHFDNVYAAIAMIGLIGLGVDLLLARLGRWLFPWDRGGGK